MDSWWAGRTELLDAVLPPACVLCARPIQAAGFCTLCEHVLTHAWPPAAVPCRFCAMPRPSVSLAQPCPRCPQQPYAFDQVIAVGPYRDALKEAIIAAKVPWHQALATSLGGLLARAVVDRVSAGSIHQVTAVPSHFLRRFLRGGIGGPWRMAETLAAALGITLRPLVYQSRRTEKQALLEDEQRVANVKGAYALKKSYAWLGSVSLKGQHVLLVDDVLTTGATACEVSRVLKQAGAAQVTLAVVARAVRD